MAAASFGLRNKKNYSYNIIEKLLPNFNGNFFDCALYETSYSGLNNIVTFIINKANLLNKKINLVHVIRGASLGNHLLLLKEYINYDEEYFKIAYYEASYKNNLELIEWLDQNYNIKENEIYYLTGLCQSNNNNKCYGCLWCNKKIDI